MKFILMRSSEFCEVETEIEINTLEDLMKFQQELGYPIILEGNTIEIYDSWRE